MKKILPLLSLSFFAFKGIAQNTIPTTTVTGALSINDSLRVTRTINSTGDISSSGDIKATGEVVSKDTMRAQKDILVDGNAVIDGDLKVAGTASVNTLRVGGPLVIGPLQPSTPDPCLMQLMIAVPETNNPTSHVLAPMDAASAHAMDFAFDTNPCAPGASPTPPVIPFTWQTYGNNVNSSNRWIGTIENFDFTIKTHSTTRLVIKNTGQMFFGTQKIKSNHPHANSQFQFDGKIGCKELVVVDPTKWADFVFDKTYKLLPLNEVEAFYLTNNHLPSVPSEAEVKEKGINTAEMDALLLQKIEELTLYIVQQQKEIEALKKEIKK